MLKSITHVGWKLKFGVRQRAVRTKLIYLVIACIAAVGAGAAVGTVLEGKVTGEIPVTVSQGLTLDIGNPPLIEGTQASIGTVSDDGTSFTAAAEISTGDLYYVTLYLVNNSKQDMVAQLTLLLPDGVTVKVNGSGSYVKNMCRTGSSTWLMNIVSGSSGAPDSWIKITVAAADDIRPGFYRIQGTLEQVTY